MGQVASGLDPAHHASLVELLNASETMPPTPTTDVLVIATSHGFNLELAER